MEVEIASCLVHFVCEATLFRCPPRSRQGCQWPVALHSGCQGGACRSTKAKVLKCRRDVPSSDSPNCVTGGNVVKHHRLAMAVEDSPALRTAFDVVFLGGM